MRPVRSRIEEAVAFYREADYPDAHCWTFTSETVCPLVRNVADLGYMPQPKLLEIATFGSEFGLRLSW